jgi:mRNA interferase RelE/StbE
MYQILIDKRALKELELTPKKDTIKIVEAIDALEDNPRPSGCKKLKGEHSDIWRIRVGNYRVLYSIADKIKVVEVVKIGHRRSVYD